MMETKGEDTMTPEVPKFLREPLSAAQAKLERLEEGAQRVLRDLMDRGHASRKDFEHMVGRLSRHDWKLPEMKQRIERLREQGVDRAVEWRGKAEAFRAEALERLLELEARAVAFLGVARRDEVQRLSDEIDALARRISRAEKGARTARAKKKTGRASRSEG